MPRRGLRYHAVFSPQKEMFSVRIQSTSSRAGVAIEWMEASKFGEWIDNISIERIDLGGFRFKLIGEQAEEIFSRMKRHFTLVHQSAINSKWSKKFVDGVPGQTQMRLTNELLHCVHYIRQKHQLSPTMEDLLWSAPAVQEAAKKLGLKRRQYLDFQFISEEDEEDVPDDYEYDE